MNVALPALIVFFVLLPGLIARAQFKLVEDSSLDYSPFGRVVLTAVLLAALGHFIWLTISYFLFDRWLDTSVFLKLLSSGPNESGAIDAAASTSSWVTIYFVTLFAASYLIPTVLQVVVRRCRLDRHNSTFSWLFRFHQAPWYYLLTGADFDEKSRPDFIIVSAVVPIGNRSWIYSGMLDEFFVDKNGVLDRLILQQVTRRPLNKSSINDQESSSEYFEIAGDYFVLRYKETITLNIEYIKLIDEAGPSGPEEKE